MSARSASVEYTKDVVQDMYRQLRSGRLGPEESSRLAVRLCMARKRVEDRGIDPVTLGFEPRARSRPGSAKPKPLRSSGLGRRSNLKEGALSCSFDQLGDPIHGDALERLERLCANP